MFLFRLNNEKSPYYAYPAELITLPLYTWKIFVLPRHTITQLHFIHHRLLFFSFEGPHPSPHSVPSRPVATNPLTRLLLQLVTQAPSAGRV